MTLEEAIKVYRACDPDASDCEHCPLEPEVSLEVGDLGHLTFSLCGLVQELEDGLEEGKEEEGHAH